MNQGLWLFPILETRVIKKKPLHTHPKKRLKIIHREKEINLVIISENTPDLETRIAKLDLEPNDNPSYSWDFFNEIIHKTKFRNLAVTKRFNNFSYQIGDYELLHGKFYYKSAYISYKDIDEDNFRAFNEILDDFDELLSIAVL